MPDYFVTVRSEIGRRIRADNPEQAEQKAYDNMHHYLDSIERGAEIVEVKEISNEADNTTFEEMEAFQAAKSALYDHVGFTEDWTVYPVDDRTSTFWFIDEDSTHVRFAKSMEDLLSDGDYFQNSIYTQRFYPKWVYRGEKMTMIFVDTHTDGNKFFAFFANAKEHNTNK